MKKSSISAMISGAVFACAFVVTKKLLNGINMIHAPKSSGAQEEEAAEIPSNTAHEGENQAVPFEKICMAVDYPFVSVPDANPIIRNGRTMLPMHALAELMGLGCVWNEYAAEATLANKNTTIAMKLGNNLVSVNGEDRATDCPAINFKGIIFLPVRFIAENLGCRVEWNEVKREFVIKG